MCLIYLMCFIFSLLCALSLLRLIYLVCILCIQLIYVCIFCIYLLCVFCVCILCIYLMYVSYVTYVCIECIFWMLYIYLFKSIAFEKTPNFFCSFQLFKYYYHEEITTELLYYNANSAIKKQKTRKSTLMDIVPHANYSDLKWVILPPNLRYWASLSAISKSKPYKKGISRNWQVWFIW